MYTVTSQLNTVEGEWL